MKKKTLISLIAGPASFLLVTLLVPDAVMKYSIRGAVGLFLWMVIWWVTSPVPVAVTSFLPVVVTALFGFVKPGDILAPYASDTIFLLIGANILTLTWEVTNLNKRIALKALCLVGPSMPAQLTAWFTLATLSSAILPNAVVVATLTPIAMAMLKQVKKDDPSTSLSAANILIAIAWGSGVGGFGTPLGGGMNLVVIGALEQYTGKELMYGTWAKAMLPIMFICLGVAVLYMIFGMKSESKSLPGAKEYFREEYAKLGKMDKVSKLSLTMFLVPLALSFTRTFWADFAPTLTGPYLFIVFGILCFCLPGNCDGRLITWKYAQPRLSWGLFYLVGGCLAIGSVIIKSGTGDYVASLIANSGISNGTVLCVVFVLVACALANVSSANSTCAIMAPLIISICTGLNLNPIPYVWFATSAANLSYIFPTAIRGVPVDYGVQPAYMLRKGLLLNIITIAVVALFAVMFLNTAWYTLI